MECIGGTSGKNPTTAVFTYYLNSTPPAEVLWTTFRATPNTTGSVKTSSETVFGGGPLTDSGSLPFSDMLRVGQGVGPNAKVGVINAWADHGVGARGRCRMNAEVDFNG